MRGLSRAPGALLMAIGALHALTGVALFRRPLVAIGRAGLVGAVKAEGEPARRLAFLFLMSAPLMFMLGQLARWTQRRAGTLPASFGWGLLAFSATGATVMPRSGFWLGIPTALLAVRVARQGPAAGDRE